eukprot:237232_1
MPHVFSVKATYFLFSWTLIQHIASECSEWTTHNVDASLFNQSEWSHIESQQSTCTYTKINDELSNDPPQIISYVGDTNQTRLYTYTLKIESERVCYDPQLVVEFEASSTVESISFQIWLDNIWKNNTFYDFTRYDQPMQCACLNGLSKRIVKVSSSSTFTDDWIVVDDIYTVESHPLAYKTKALGVRMIVVPNLEDINDLADTAMLNASILLSCSTALEWSFDFEENQTIFTFTVAMFVFILLLSITICKIRHLEWKDQCLQHQIDQNSFGELSLGTRCKLLFISHDPQFRFANTWIWYIVTAFGLVGFPILLLSFGQDIHWCSYFLYLYLIQGPAIVVFLTDFHWWRAKYPFKPQFLKMTKCISDRCTCFRRLDVSRISFVPYISYVYIFLTICHGIWYRGFYCNYGWWAYLFLYFGYCIPSALSVFMPTFIFYWLCNVMFWEFASIPQMYWQIWSIIFSGMPTMLMVLLLSNDPRLNRLFPPFRSLAISLYDAFTDINLIVLWFSDPQLFNYAILQIIFILMGQIVGAIDVYCTKCSLCRKNTVIFTESNQSVPGQFDCNTCQGKFGFVSTALVGRVMYVWNIDKELDAFADSDTEDRLLTNNEVVMQTLKINEMVWESIFSVALQLYISTAYNQFNQTVLFSLATSFLNVTDSLHNFVENDKNSVKSLRAEGWVNWSAWLFIVSDFLYRILPNIAFSVFIDKLYNQHYGYGSAPTYICMAVLLFLNLLMEYAVLIGNDFKLHRIRHCILSLVSSAYLLFGALNTNGVVKIHPNYTFEMVKKESNWRMMLSGCITLICFVWQVIAARSVERSYPELIGLMIAEGFCVVVNVKMRSMFEEDIIQTDCKESADQQVEMVETKETEQGRDTVNMDKVQDM